MSFGSQSVSSALQSFHLILLICYLVFELLFSWILIFVEASVAETTMEKPFLDYIFSLLSLLPFVVYVCIVSVPFLVVKSTLNVGSCIDLTFYLLGYSVSGFSLPLSLPLWD